MDPISPKTAPTALVAVASPDEGRELAAVLAAAGFHSQVAQNRADCLQLARIIRPDLILADFKELPADDLSICQALKSGDETRRIPILALAGASDPEWIARLFAAGVMDCLLRPVRPVELVFRAKRLLTGPPQGPERNPDDPLAQIVATSRKLCHELNQPLQYVLGSVQLLMMDVAAEHPMHASLANIRIQVERMGQLNARLMESIRSINPTKPVAG